jgi:hypothetical protein
VRDETDELRRRLETLEAAISEIESHRPARGAPANNGSEGVSPSAPAGASVRRMRGGGRKGV